MEVTFADSRLQKRCEARSALVRVYGPRCGGKVMTRLADLRAATTLEEMRDLPGDCHELKGDRRRQLAVKLEGAWRLVFAPTHNPAPTKPDGGLDWERVTAVRIIDIVDYHD